MKTLFVISLKSSTDFEESWYCMSLNWKSKTNHIFPELKNSVLLAQKKLTLNFQKKLSAT